MGFGTEMLFLVVLGLVVLGPERLQGLLVQLGRAKAEWDRTRRTIETRVVKELENAARQDSPPRTG
jgi:Sec-independent protein translocase protein TatA